MITRQLRLRDIGGIIVIDFIDLTSKSHRNRVVLEVKKELKKDRASFDILPMSDFGLVQLTRGRVRPSLLYRYSESCPRCNGLGRIPAKSTIVTKIERSIQKMKSKTGERRLVLRVHPDIVEYLTEGIRSRVRRLMAKFFITIRLIPDCSLMDDNFILTSLKDKKKSSSV